MLAKGGGQAAACEPCPRVCGPGLSLPPPLQGCLAGVPSLLLLQHDMASLVLQGAQQTGPAHPQTPAGSNLKAPISSFGNTENTPGVISLVLQTLPRGE